MIVSLESFQKGDIPDEVKMYIAKCKGNIFTILDESSKIKTNNPCKESKKSKRTQGVLKLNRFGERCILTGTFMSKSPVNAYDQMNFLCPKFFQETIYQFAERYTLRRSLKNVRGARTLISEADYKAIRTRLLRGKQTGNAYLYSATIDSVCSFYGIKYNDCEWILKHEEYTPFRNIEELWKRIGDTCVNVDRHDVLDVPEKVYTEVPVMLTNEQKKLYTSLLKTYCTDRVTVENGLELYIRFQDVCNGYEPVEQEDETVTLEPLAVNPKLDALEEVVENIGDAQCIVWCSRSQLLYDAVERMKKNGYTCGVYDGKISKAERTAHYNSFRDKKIQLLFINQSSGAYGLDRLKDADYEVYLCNDYSVEHRQQSEDRIDRGEHTSVKNVIDIVCRGTVEDKVTSALKQGKELLSTGKTDTSLFEGSFV